MELTQQLFVAGLVLGLLSLSVAAAQRLGWLRTNFATRSRPERSLALVERISMTPQHQLHLVRVDDRTLLIATHPQGVEVVESRAGAAVSGGRA